MAGSQHSYTLSPGLGQLCLLLPVLKSTLGCPCTVRAQQDSAFLSLTRDTLLEDTQGGKNLTLTCAFLLIHPAKVHLGIFRDWREARKAAGITACLVAQLQSRACSSAEGTQCRLRLAENKRHSPLGGDQPLK